MLTWKIFDNTNPNSSMILRANDKLTAETLAKGFYDNYRIEQISSEPSIAVPIQLTAEELLEIRNAMYILNKYMPKILR